MNASRDSLTLACLVAVATALLAACGGSGERGETLAEDEGFAAAADRICAEVARNDIAARREASGSQAEYLRQLQRNREQALRALEQLSPPADGAARYEEFLARRQAAVTGIADGIAAAAEATAFDRFRVAARQRVVAAQRVAAELGLSACAGSLPEPERAQVEAAITSSVDAGRAEEFCIRHTSEAMIATYFGTRARCLAEQSRRPASQTVAVVELQGIAGVSADAIVELGDGDGDEPARYEVALVHEGGSWRYESVSPAPQS